MTTGNGNGGSIVCPAVMKYQAGQAVYEWVGDAIRHPFDPDVYAGLVLSIRTAKETMTPGNYASLCGWLRRVKFGLAVRDAESNCEFTVHMEAEHG